MLTGVQVRDALGRLVATFGMSELNPTTKYVITDIAGQGPVKSEIKTSPFGSSDGEAFQSANTPKRNMVFTLGYNPNYAKDETVEDLRLALYRILPPKATVNFRMLNSKMEAVSIQGWVESLEPDIWTAEPSVVISIICPLPNFKSLVTTTIQTDSDEAYDLVYPGSAVTGFTFKMDATSNINSLQLVNGVDTLYLNAGVSNGQSLTVNTIQGSRSIKRSDGVNLLNSLQTGSLYMGLGPINTYYRFTARNGSDARTAKGTLTFKTEYAGI
jgi:hypothetical protein